MARPSCAGLTLCVLARWRIERRSGRAKIELLLRRGRDFVPGASLGRVMAGSAVLLALALAGAAWRRVAFAQRRAIT